MKTTPLCRKNDPGEIAASVSMVFGWVSILLVAFAGAANAQTVVNQPTTTTLWAGSQDITLPLNFILGSVSTPHAAPAAKRSPATTWQIKDTGSATFAGMDTSPANNKFNVTTQPK